MIKKIILEFKEKPISIKKAWGEYANEKGKNCTKSTTYKYYLKCKYGDSFAKHHPKGSLFNHIRIHPNRPVNTITANHRIIYHWQTMRNLSDNQFFIAGSYPFDYRFLKTNPGYLIGMSVPPLMTFKIVRAVISQLFSKDSVKDFTYKWNLSDLKEIPENGLKVFSCFSCGGGSTMGYKMAGCEVIGCNEIDPEMMTVYKKNHNPKYSYLESISTFRHREDLPKEFYNLDILDGSPPCSSFSISGNREKNWGQKKQFREGQQKQILDDLFFDYIDLADKLRPKVIIAENVKGMLIGKAKGYVKEILKRFKAIGYYVQLFLLNGANMGLPQKRERIFFICQRQDGN